MSELKYFHFHQLFEAKSSTYTYLLFDEESKEGVIIDPVRETAARDIKLIQELGVRLKTILETHVHADHVTGACALQQELGGEIALSHQAKVIGCNRRLKENDGVSFGKYLLKVMETPGHTNTCLSYFLEFPRPMVFTGDTLLIRKCGRTDFQEGSSEKLFKSVREKLFSLPDVTEVFPAHNYEGVDHSSIGEEKKYNQRLSMDKNEQQFINTMANLKLDYPKQMDLAVPLNLRCGRD